MPMSGVDADLGLVAPGSAPDLPEPLGYRLKRRLLGAPLTNDQLSNERLSKVLALGVLAPDCISSSAHGTEEILIELLPYAALGAFALVLPITGVVLAILLLLTLSYREVVSVYTKAGGSYEMARENFGPKVAQVAAVAADRLCGHCRGADGGGHGGGGLGGPAARPVQPGDHRGGGAAAVLRQPAGP